VLIEPDRDDRLMFETSLMSYSSRIEIAKHGFRTITHKLAGDYDSLKEICARHGVEISADRVRECSSTSRQSRSAARAGGDLRADDRRAAASSRRRLNHSGEKCAGWDGAQRRHPGLTCR